jgi:hypothetical protein
LTVYRLISSVPFRLTPREEGIVTATHVVSGDQYREVDRRMSEIKRQLNQPGGSPLDPDIVARRLQLIIEGPSAAPTGSTTLDDAAAIMGQACHGIDELERHLAVTLSASEAAQLATVPFSQEALLDSRPTHVLVACAPVSLMGLRAKASDAFYFKKAWYAREDFARRPLRARWRLLRREPVGESTSKPWSGQQALLRPNELVPGVCEMALAIVLHYLATGERLLPTAYVRTCDVDSAGRRVGLGRFGRDGLRIRSWGDYPDYYVGLAAARKSSWSRAALASRHAPRPPTSQAQKGPVDRGPAGPRFARRSGG